MNHEEGVCWTCDECGGTFIEGRPEEEANAEAEKLFGIKNASEQPGMARVCDDCFNEIMRRINS